MIQQVSGGAQGSVADMKIASAEADRYMDTLIGIMAEASGKKTDQVRSDCDRDYFMSAEEAVKYGLIDKVLEPGSR